MRPLILTLRMDAAAQSRFDGLRRSHFPPERNHIPAHLTLFHHLPGEEEAAVRDDLERACAEEARVPLRATGLRFLGRGVAFRIEGPRLAGLRGRLAEGWRAWLTPQDDRRLDPHVTVQNKVSPERARATHDRLQAGFVPFEVTGEGLLLWRYLGGPWEPLGEYPFRGP